MKPDSTYFAFISKVAGPQLALQFAKPALKRGTKVEA